MSRELLKRNEAEEQVLALVKVDQALRQVSLQIARTDKRNSGRVVGSINIEGTRFDVFAEERDMSAQADGLHKLTNREMQIACLVREGACNKQIARRLRISPYTVASYLKRMFPKLGCTSRSELAAMVAHVHPLT